MKDRFTVIVFTSGESSDAVHETVRAMGRAYARLPCQDWARLPQALAGAHCGILLGLDRSNPPDYVEGLPQEIPPLITVAASSDDDPVAPSPLTSHVVERLESQYLGRDILRMVTKAILEHFYQTIPQRMQANRILESYPLVQSAWSVAVKKECTSVAGLARSLGYTTRHLEREWAAAAEELESTIGRRPPPLKRLLRVLLYIRALLAWLDDPHLRRPWKEIASELGVTSRTLRTISRELAGTSSRDLKVRHVPGVIRRIEDQIVA